MRKFNLPDKLAFFRIILVPIFILVLLLPIKLGQIKLFGQIVPMTQIIATIIFAIASITDFIDGKIARAKHIVTDFGKFIDPLADKMLVMSAFACLISLNLVPAWIVAIILCREFAVTGLRLIAAESNGKVIAAAWSGKIKTTAQMLSIVFLLFNQILIGNILLYICLFFTIYSGAEYFIKNKNVFKA